ncbi:MAG: hypothetical protein ACLSGC_07925 [Bifidobacterium pseudocatenulatum]
MVVVSVIGGYWASLVALLLHLTETAGLRIAPNVIEGSSNAIPLSFLILMVVLIPVALILVTLTRRSVAQSPVDRRSAVLRANRGKRVRS